MAGDAKWTLEALREYFERLLAEKDRQYAQRFEAQEKAVVTAQESARAEVAAALAAQKELASVVTAAQKELAAALAAFMQEWKLGANEWRGSMNDRERIFATKEALANLERRVQEIFEKLGQFATLAAMDRRFETVGAEFKALDVQIADLKTHADLGRGKGMGIEMGWQWVIGAATLAGIAGALLW